jgi:hypothetical protein
MGVVFGLEHGGRQMLGLNSRELSSPKHEGTKRRWETKVRREGTTIVNANYNCSQVSHQ